MPPPAAPVAANVKGSHLVSTRWAPVVTLCGVPVSAVGLDDTLEIIDQMIGDAQPHYNVAINAAKVVAYQTDPLLRDAVTSASLLTADGQPIVWAAALLGRPIKGRVNGTDMMEQLLARSASRGWKIYLLGATDDVLGEFIRRAMAKHPDLKIAGFRNGYFSFRDEVDIIRSIRETSPDLLFLGFGTPAKEYFMLRNCQLLNVPFTMGVGGSFDVFAGRVRRAPRIMQRCGLEWFFRLIQEPRRMWRRYLIGNLAFLRLILRELISLILRKEDTDRIA